MTGSNWQAIRLKRGTENGEQATESGEWGKGKGQRKTRNGKWGTGNGESLNGGIYKAGNL